MKFLLQESCRSDDLGGNAPPLCVQHTFLRLREAGEVPVLDLAEGSLQSLQPLLHGFRFRPEGRRSLVALARNGRPGIAQQHLLGPGVRRQAVGLEEGARLPGREPVAKRGVGKTPLRLALEAAKVEGHGQA
jgi:hypothetical protein